MSLPRFTASNNARDGLEYPYALAIEPRRCGIFFVNQAVKYYSSIAETYSGDVAPTELEIIWQRGYKDFAPTALGNQPGSKISG